MNDFTYEVLKTFALTHNYNRWIINLLRPFVGENILEVGCGTGNLTVYLKEMGQLRCLDKSEYFLEHMRIDHPDVQFYHLDITDDRVYSLKKEGFDTIICVNVMEHIENDIKALKMMHSIMRPGGRLLLIVPAMPFLYNGIDKKLGHFRRYEKRELRNKMEKVGFVIEKMSYRNVIGMIGWFLRGKFSRGNKFPLLSTMLFDRFIFLLKIEELFHLPFGMTLFVVAQKI